MKVRSWPILAIAFGATLLLLILFGLDSYRRASEIYARVLEIQRTHNANERALRDLETGIYLSGILIRDFLLDRSDLAPDLYRGQLVRVRDTMTAKLRQIRGMQVSDGVPLFADLAKEVDSYWDSMEPVLDWTPQQKISLSALFLRKQVLPRRDAVIDIASEAQRLNEINYREQQRHLRESMQESARAGQRALALTLLLGALVSFAGIARVSTLESRAERTHAATERAERQMRALSLQLVHAQEEERRRLSRELHDEIGQILTALKVELGNLQRLGRDPSPEFANHLADARELTEQTMKAVRGMALGLRPSMLDDVGLDAAVEWQAREFSRRTGVPADVTVEQLPSDLPEAHRTALYRVVQEALTNCARHASPSRVRIRLEGSGGSIRLTIEDDGCGFEPFARSPGIGLIGIGERVRELGGDIAIDSSPGAGARIAVAIPLRQEAVA